MKITQIKHDNEFSMNIMNRSIIKKIKQSQTTNTKILQIEC